ncbi:hypothetical protein ZWY2020_034937 [Hordeum vulgare]|nr:hypothetical protein ZWY2020_034937 [Hordeum vulgare]
MTALLASSIQPLCLHASTQKECRHKRITHTQSQHPTPSAAAFIRCIKPSPCCPSIHPLCPADFIASLCPVRCPPLLSTNLLCFFLVLCKQTLPERSYIVCLLILIVDWFE